MFKPTPPILKDFTKVALFAFKFVVAFVPPLSSLNSTEYASFLIKATIYVYFALLLPPIIVKLPSKNVLSFTEDLVMLLTFKLDLYSKTSKAVAETNVIFVSVDLLSSAVTT